MDFDLTDEQIMFRDMARAFAQREILPYVKEDERNEYFRMDTVKKMGELGLLAITVPEEYGGLGADYICYSLICEEIGYASLGTFTTTLGVQGSLFHGPLLSAASEEQKRKYFPKTTKGELVGCFGLTEPNVGSDAASMETTAVKKGDKWVLNGNKMWISNGGIADLALVFAQTDKSKGHRGVAAFLIEKGTPGFTTRDIHGKMGIRSSNTAELIFQDCAVPEENLIGRVGDGFRIAMQALDGARLGTGAAAVGVSQAAIDAAVKYAQERKQFGKPIGSFQLVQDMIANMVVKTDAARCLVYRAAALRKKGQAATKEVGEAKFFASETALEVTRTAIQIHGGYGYSDEYPVERYMRDAMALVLYEGTSQIQKLIIARETIGIAAFV